MANPRKAKGTKFETEVKDLANDVLGHRTKAYRPAQTGHQDVGDIHGVSPFIFQTKNWKDLVGALREGVDGAVKQAKHAGETWGVAVVKRARKNTADAYAVMRYADWLAFYADYLDLRAEVDRLRAREQR